MAKLQPEPVENHIRPKARRWKKVAGSALAVTLAGLLVWLGGTPMLTAIAQASILPQLLALAMGIASYVVAAERWKTVTNYLAKREVAPTIVYLDIRVLTGAAGYLVPRELAEMGGRVAWLTRMRDVSLGAATLGIVVDRFGDFAIMAIGLLPALLYLSGVLPVSLAFAFAFVLLLLAAIFGATLTGSVARSVRYVFKAGTQKTSSPRLAKFLANISNLRTVDHRVLRWVYLYSVIKYLFLLARLVLIAYAVGLSVDWQRLILLFPLSQLAYGFAVTPGSIGVYELGWFALLRSVSEPGALAAFVVLLRFNMIASVVSLVLFGRVARLLNWIS